MRRLLASIAAAAVTLSPALQSSAQEAPTWSPVEIFGCNWVGGAGMDDLDRVIAAWNRWMDQNDQNDYAAFVLTPHFTAASFEYDVGWFGVWRNGDALAGEQLWLTQGASINEDFGEVVDCPLHQAMAIAQVRDIGEVAEGDIVPVEFTNCTINEGRTGPEAHAAIIEYANYMAEQGSRSGHWVLRVGPGEEPDATYSFKWLSAYPSWAEAGRDFERFFNGGADAVLGDLTGRIFSCDPARLYDTRLVRDMPEE